MLSPHEFTVGSFGNAKPGSFILPRTKYEAPVLIGETEKGPAAVFLSGQFRFQFFQSSGNADWGGLIIPSVRVEVDEASLFDPNSEGNALGSIIRTETKLVVQAKAERSFGRSTPVILHSDLSAAEGSAGFAKWRIVIGEGHDMRVLHEIDLAEANSNAD